MYGINAYQQQKPSALPRIDLLMMAYDGVIERLQKAKVLFEKKEDTQAIALLARSQAIVVEMMAGLDLSRGEVPQKVQSLYIFVLQQIGLGEKIDIPAALKVLETLRSGLREIRDEGIKAENEGAIPSLGKVSTFSTSG